MPGFIGQIDEPGEPLDPRVGVRSKPKAVDILGVLQPDKSVVQHCAKGANSATISDSWNVSATSCMTGYRWRAEASKYRLEVSS